MNSYGWADVANVLGSCTAGVLAGFVLERAVVFFSRFGGRA